MNIKLLTAAELMTPHPIMIEPAATLRAAALIMCQQKLHCLLVPSERGHCVGVITSKDIVQILCDGEPELLDQLHVADALTSPAISVQEQFLVVDCLRLMRMSGVRSVPVLRGLTAVGILSFTDVLYAAVNPASSLPTGC
jgi:CBS domain-containing protein